MEGGEKKYWLCAVAILAAFAVSVTLLFTVRPPCEKPREEGVLHTVARGRIVSHIEGSFAVFAPEGTRGVEVSTDRRGARRRFTISYPGYPSFTAQKGTIYILEGGAVRTRPYSIEEFNRLCTSE